VPAEFGGGPWARFGTMLAVTLLGAVLTYHLVEKPSIALGRKVTTARRRRLAAAVPARHPAGTPSRDGVPAIEG
jgi:peptidoglycan/LPS O-acetylase OafA/YrhL